MNVIWSGKFGRRYATRFSFWRFQTRAEARAYVRLPLARQGQTLIGKPLDWKRRPTSVHCVSGNQIVRVSGP